MPTPCLLKHLCSIRALVPMSFFLFFCLLLSYRRLRTTGFWSNKGPTSGAQKQGLGTRGRFGWSDPQGLLSLVSTKTWVSQLESPLTFLLCFITHTHTHTHIYIYIYIYCFRLETISCTVIREKDKRQLEKLLAYENANQVCQKAITPICETGTIIDYLKACHSLRPETQKMQMLAETMVAALRKGNEGCFTCGDKTHLKKDCPKKVKASKQTKKLSKNLPSMP